MTKPDPIARAIPQSEDWKCSLCGKPATVMVKGGESCHYCGNEIDLCDDCGERLKHELSVFFPDYRPD